MDLVGLVGYWFVGGSAVDWDCLRGGLGDWYEGVRRDLPWRRTRDPYAIWVSEVMLQQTQVKTVIPYYERFLERFPDVAALAGAELQAVYKLWEGLGYYSRARHLHAAAGMVMARMGGRVPRDPQVLRGLPGIGDYIAAAVLSIAFDQPFAVVDGNVKRVLARVFMMDTPVNHPPGHARFQEMADRLLDRTHPGRHNQALMELGALVCTPKQPLCPQCPWTAHCRALRSDAVADFPRRVQRRRPGEQFWVAGAVLKKGRLLLTRRPGRGLLAGLWEFPCVAMDGTADPAADCTAMVRHQVGLHCGPPHHLVTVRHAYTHFKLRMALYLCPWQGGRVRLNGPDHFAWVRPDQLDSLPLHGAVHKVLPALLKALREQ